ncbi:MAG: FHA domain-containing protein [Planctomycetota bacterium]
MSTQTPLAKDQDGTIDVALLLHRETGIARRFELKHGATVIGRREDCGLRIPLGDVSRKHCQLVCDGQSVLVQDLGSSNGTFVNNRRVQESPMLAGDRLMIGSLTFVIQIDGEPINADAANADSGTMLHELLDGQDPSSHLNPTAQADAGDGEWGLDPSGAAADIEELMND